MTELLAAWGAINLVLPLLGWRWGLRRRQWDDAR